MQQYVYAFETINPTMAPNEGSRGLWIYPLISQTVILASENTGVYNTNKERSREKQIFLLHLFQGPDYYYLFSWVSEVFSWLQMIKNAIEMVHCIME